MQCGHVRFAFAATYETGIEVGEAFPCPFHDACVCDDVPCDVSSVVSPARSWDRNMDCREL